jgi:hypothetical protein
MQPRYETLHLDPDFGSWIRNMGPKFEKMLYPDPH